MKKIIFAILIFLAVCLAACTENPDPPHIFTTVPTESTAVFLETIDFSATTETSETSLTDSSATETTASSEKPPEPPQEKSHIYMTGHGCTTEFIESETRILFTYGTQLMYYDKVGDVCRAFCFDPLCTHEQNSDCLSWQFEYLHWPYYEKMLYMEEPRRIYAQRGENLYSFSTDGSDVRLECSLGDFGAWGVRNYTMSSRFSTVQSMERYDSFLYFFKVNADTGNLNFYRYDTKTRKLEMLSSGDELPISSWYFFAGESVYFAAVIDGIFAMYRANPDFSEPERLENVPVSLVDGISDGNLMYYVEMDYTADRKVPIAISTFDLKTGENRQILPFSDGDIRRLLFVTDEWLYFSVENEFSIGTYWGWGAETKAITTHQAIYKIRKDGSSEPEKVFENMSGGVNELFISGNTALIKRYIRTIDGKDSFFRNYVSKVTVDENGNFTDWEELF